MYTPPTRLGRPSSTLTTRPPASTPRSGTSCSPVRSIRGTGLSGTRGVRRDGWNGIVGTRARRPTSEGSTDAAGVTAHHPEGCRVGPPDPALRARWGRTAVRASTHLLSARLPTPLSRLKSHPESRYTRTLGAEAGTHEPPRPSPKCAASPHHRSVIFASAVAPVMTSLTLTVYMPGGSLKALGRVKVAVPLSRTRFWE